MSTVARNDPHEFLDWLERQVKRDDSVGELARAWADEGVIAQVRAQSAKALVERLRHDTDPDP